MMTAQRAECLAQAAGESRAAWKTSATALLRLVRMELGHDEILDGFRPYGSGQARAIPLAPLLHIVSGNTPHAAVQSLTRGLLLGAENFCKLPSSGLPEIEDFLAKLPPALSQRVVTHRELSDKWLDAAAAVIVFGADETIEFIRERLRPDQLLLAHGHRISLGIVFEDPDWLSVEGAARDASLFDQQGCLSPHCFYVGGCDSREYAARLATEMQTFHHHTPRGNVSVSAHAAIRELRRETAFKIANGEPLTIWESPGDTAWTVIHDTSKTFTPSPLNRVIYVRPMPDDLKETLRPIRRWLSTIGIFPLSNQNAEQAAQLGASRICQIGSMQFPPTSWHQDGLPQLAALVRWIDFDKKGGN